MSHERDKPKGAPKVGDAAVDEKQIEEFLARLRENASSSVFELLNDSNKHELLKELLRRKVLTPASHYHDPGQEKTGTILLWCVKQNQLELLRFLESDLQFKAGDSISKSKYTHYLENILKSVQSGEMLSILRRLGLNVDLPSIVYNNSRFELYTSNLEYVTRLTEFAIQGKFSEVVAAVKGGANVNAPSHNSYSNKDTPALVTLAKWILEMGSDWDATRYADAIKSFQYLVIKGAKTEECLVWLESNGDSYKDRGKAGFLGLAGPENQFGDKIAAAIRDAITNGPQLRDARAAFLALDSMGDKFKIFHTNPPVKHMMEYLGELAEEQEKPDSSSDRDTEPTKKSSKDAPGGSGPG